MAESLVVDAYGRTFNYNAAPQDPVSPIRQTWDPFAGRTLGRDEIPPEMIARAIAKQLSLSQTQMLCKRVLDNDSRFAGFFRDYSDAISGLDWEVIPREKSSRSDKRIASKVAEDLEEQLAELPVSNLISNLVWGDYSPFGWAENVWDLQTKDLRGWEFPDATRQYWDPMKSTLRLLTKDAQSFGLDLAPNMWVLHSSSLRPGGPREGGYCYSVFWDYAIKHYVIADWLELSDIWGMPWVFAMIEDPKDRDAVIKAVQTMSRKGRGAFPKGTDVKIEHGTGTGSSDIFEKLAARCDDNASIIFTGHDLIAGSKSGTGTLANKGAQRVAEKLIKKGARAVMDTFRRDVAKVRATIKFGYDVAMEYCPTWKLKYEPPIDVLARGRAFVMVNQILAPLGKAIAEQQVLEEFSIAEIVDVKATAPPEQTPAKDSGNDNADLTVDASRRPRRRVAAAASAAHPLATHEDVESMGAALAQRQFAAAGADIHDIINSVPLEEAAAAIWESYPDIGRPRKFASLARDVMVTSAVIGMADAHTEVASANS
jgi:phage gp29-like protein